MSQRWAIFLLTLGCADSTPGRDVPASAKDEPAQLSAEGWAIRASLDLRGVRPTAAELDAAVDEAAVLELIEGWAQSEAFATRAAWIWNGRVRSALYFENTELRSWQSITQAQRRLLGWEPLEHVRSLVAQNRPFSDLVLATELPIHPDIASVWGWDAPATEGWSEAPPQDLRPAAGILSSSSLWFVYDGDATNYNRRRANALSVILLCEDFLARQVNFDNSLSLDDLAQMEQAARTVPSCQACHSALDPLGALMGAFAERSVAGETQVLGQYSPWGAEWSSTSSSPAWFGHPVGSLEDMALLISQDRRFARCATRTLAEGLLGETLDDYEQLDTWTDLFVEQNMDLRALAVQVVQSPAYRVEDERILSVEQLASALGDWLSADPQVIEELTWDTQLRLLAGGTDDWQVLERNREPALGHHVAMAWAARSLSADALEEDASRGTPLLWSVEPFSTAEDSVRAQLVDWHLRWLGERVASDDPRIDRMVELWQNAGGATNAPVAWDATLQALIRHPRALFY